MHRRAVFGCQERYRYPERVIVRSPNTSVCVSTCVTVSIFAGVLQKFTNHVLVFQFQVYPTLVHTTLQLDGFEGVALHCLSKLKYFAFLQTKSQTPKWELPISSLVLSSYQSRRISSTTAASDVKSCGCCFTFTFFVFSSGLVDTCACAVHIHRLHENLRSGKRVCASPVGPLAKTGQVRVECLRA